ncbi:MAG TPA: hypothetical protein VKS79_03290 [Gemmataceae bacterium]|nr:hypothetical protein [Gemmataceae bacterium]
MPRTPNASTKAILSPSDDEDRIEQELLADGILDQLPLPVSDGSAFHRWQPIAWAGKPLSETILEERR